MKTDDAPDRHAGARASQQRGGGVIPELDIWRAANLLIKQHGAAAALEARGMPAG